MTAIITGSAFPDPDALDWKAPCSTHGWPNLAFRSRASRVYFPEHEGVLSIKCAFHGQEIYEVLGRPMTVEDTCYLILNEGQRYASYIDADTPVESVCVFFHPQFARSLLRSLTSAPERLLDDPVGGDGAAPFFVERLYPHDQIISPVLLRIREALRTGSASREWLEEQFHVLLERMLAVRSHVFTEAERLASVRASTRLELYQRLYWAKEYIDANAGQSLNLAQIAEIACLSPHHFLRLFKQLFSVTPHQYLTLRRLEMAQHLLRKTELPVTDICLEVGFVSLGTFSCLFRRRHGVSPLQYRRVHSPPRFAVGCALPQQRQ
ncbi:MAG TPA: AraC family transcriptional regulator [Chthonomonadaceae bacterium]|nr:AraC family transcriptional regulator [Chthonomonadaceae bacterium]